MVLYHFSYSSDLLRVIFGMSALSYFKLYERLMVSESFISEGKVAPGALRNLEGSLCGRSLCWNKRCNSQKTDSQSKRGNLQNTSVSASVWVSLETLARLKCF